MKYKVVLSWYGETYTFHTVAVSEASAKINAIIKLTKKLNKEPGSCYAYFSGDKDNFKVTPKYPQ